LCATTLVRRFKRSRKRRLPIPPGGTWNDENVILFSRRGSDGILRVAAGGGEPEKLMTADTAAGLTGLFPAFLPGGRHFLYLKIVGPSIAENSQLMWRALDSADERVVRNMYSKAFYSPTGHLLFSLGGPVVAQAFDASTGTVSGDPVQLVGDTVKEGASTSLAFSPAGVLAHRPGSASAVAQLSWLDRDGKVVATVGAAGDYLNAAIDRAGERVVANIFNPRDVWLLDSRRGTTSRITSDPAIDSDPIFSPDGRWVVFYSARQPAGIYRKASTARVPRSWSRRRDQTRTPTTGRRMAGSCCTQVTTERGQACGFCR
jgi:eukaryotic-like serine/threonine-protein kinase